MKQDERSRRAVEAAWTELQRQLVVLADELASSESDWGSGEVNDAVSTGSRVKDLSDELAAALSEWLPEIPAHDKLDAFLHELAERRSGAVFERAAQATAEMLEFLRQISYGSLPNIEEAPDAEEVNGALEQLLDELGVAT